MAFRGSYPGPGGSSGYYGPPDPYGPPGNPGNPGGGWPNQPGPFPPQPGYSGYGPGQPGMSGMGPPPPSDFGARRAPSPESYPWTEDPPLGFEEDEGSPEARPARAGSLSGPAAGRHQHRARRPANRDEFDGPTQFLPPPSPRTVAALDRELPHLATNLLAPEQDELLGAVHECLSAVAFRFVARYQFPIPLEPDKRAVRAPGDREWTEWVHLLRRLATKRRVPARVLYHGQIKQLVTVLENSLEMRHAAKHQSRPLKDDRNVLQLISAGLQVAKILKDAGAMEFLDGLYVHSESLIQERKSQPPYLK